MNAQQFTTESADHTIYNITLTYTPDEIRLIEQENGPDNPNRQEMKYFQPSLTIQGSSFADCLDNLRGAVLNLARAWRIAEAMPLMVKYEQGAGRSLLAEYTAAIASVDQRPPVPVGLNID